MIEALNDFMAAVFEPVFVLALLGVLRIGWHWRRKRPIPPGIAWMAFFLMFMLLWRIPMRIQSSRYSCAAMIPCAILAAWVLADWIADGGRGLLSRRWRQWLVGVGCLVLAVGAGVKNFRSERDRWQATRQAAQVLRTVLNGAESPAVITLTEHGSRVLYYSGMVKADGSGPALIRLADTGYDSVLALRLTAVDRAVFVIRAGADETALQEALAVIGVPKPFRLGEFPMRKYSVALWLLDNRSSPSFGCISPGDLSPLPEKHELVFVEDFEYPKEVPVKDNSALRRYRELGFSFVVAETVALPRTVTLVEHYGMERNDPACTEIGVRSEPGGNRVLTVRSTDVHTIRLQAVKGAGRRCFVEFEMQGEKGALIEVGRLLYAGKIYLGEQRNCGRFYALDSKRRFFRMELKPPAAGTEWWIPSMYLHGNLSIDNLRIYSVPYEKN